MERYPEIELLLWKKAYAVYSRQVVTAMRHRFCCLYLTSGILRGETVYNAELSDFQGIVIQQNDTDIHPIFCMIMQIPFGKTNKGRT